MWPCLVFKNITCNIRNVPLLRLPAAKSTSYDINSVFSRVCLLAKVCPNLFKYDESTLELKTEMKDLGNINCFRILCQYFFCKE